MAKMTFKVDILLFTILLLCSCSNSTSDKQIDELKNNLRSSLAETKKILDTLDCQAKQYNQAIVYRDLVKDLNEIINSFIDTSSIIPIKNLGEKVSLLNVVYHVRVDSSIKSTDYKLFPGTDNVFIYASFFKVDSTSNEFELKYYLTCVKIMDEHLKIIKNAKPKFSHDPCKN